MGERRSPIINSPFEEPAQHWRVRRFEEPRVISGRRESAYYYRIPERSGRGRPTRHQKELLPEPQVGEREELALVNALRRCVTAWRTGAWTGRPYDGVSPISRELLELWRAGGERRGQRLFFAQLEAAETIIFLTEAVPVYRKGLAEVPRDEPGPSARAAGRRAFTRLACKMATGSGKTTVMGMLIAWSVLNRQAQPNDERFTDTVLVVCPNVTIRERLQELDPALGDLSLYRTRQLAPPHHMEALRRGEVMIVNWHKLARQEANRVNGDRARVVKTGEPVEVAVHAGRADERRELRWFESDPAWFRRIRREHGNGKGRAAQWLVFNDEAHHAYRRGDVGADDAALDEDAALIRKNAREATVWIDGLDRINRLAGGRRNGIRLCVDLSATPFYIQGSGNEVGRPFPWIVSDFGLLDAIESGLVKIPQLPARDATGAEEAGYFNIWRWVEERLAADRIRGAMTPDKVLRYASRPMLLLAESWKRRFDAWNECARENYEPHPTPPVFIVVCRDTALAKRVYEWLALGRHEGDCGQPPEGFRNQAGRERTVRIDSRVWEDIEAGSGSDEEKRLRFVLDTVGKKTWPGGRPPEDWIELARRHNEKVHTDNGGRLIRCRRPSRPGGKCVASSPWPCCPRAGTPIP